MTFDEAKAVAAAHGAKVPRYDATAPVAQCWIDRVRAFQMYADKPAALLDAVLEANRYAGR